MEERRKRGGPEERWEERNEGKKDSVEGEKGKYRHSDWIFSFSIFSCNAAKILYLAFLSGVQLCCVICHV